MFRRDSKPGLGVVRQVFQHRIEVAGLFARGHGGPVHVGERRREFAERSRERMTFP